MKFFLYFHVFNNFIKKSYHFSRNLLINDENIEIYNKNNLIKIFCNFC